jgi:hypothetical protein
MTGFVTSTTSSDNGDLVWRVSAIVYDLVWSVARYSRLRMLAVCLRQRQQWKLTIAMQG